MTDAEKFDWVWRRVLPKRAPRRHKEALTQLRAWLETHGGKIASALLSDFTGSWTAEEMDELLQSLMEEFSSGQKPSLLAGLLRAVVQRWLDSNGIDLPLPDVVRSTKQAKHPRRGGLVPALREHKLLRQALYAANRAASSSAACRVPDPLALGVVSAIVNFRCLHPDSIFSIIEACSFPRESFFLVESEIAMWQSLPINGVPNAEGRVVVLDHFTALMLMRVSPTEAKGLLDSAEGAGGSHAKSRDALLRELTERIHRCLVRATPTHKHMTIQHMIATCEIAADRFLPRCIISYLARKFVSASTSPEVIARIEPTTVLLTVAPSAHRRQPASSLKKFMPKALPETDEGPEFVAMPTWAIEFFKNIGGTNLRTIRAELTRLSTQSDIPPVGRYLAEFGLLLAEPRGNKTLDAGTLHIYLDLLFRHVVSLFEEGDPAEIGKEGADDLYEEIWNDFVQSSSGQSRSSQSRFAILLIGFHRFLIDNYQAKELEDFRPAIAGAREIYANIVSLEEFAELTSAIANSSSFHAPKPSAWSRSLLCSLPLAMFFSWNSSRPLARRDKTNVGSGSIWQQSVMLEPGSQTDRCVLIVRSQMIRLSVSLICLINDGSSRTLSKFALGPRFLCDMCARFELLR